MVQRISLQNYPPLFQKATNSLMNQQYEKAQKLFKKCLQLNPSSYSSYLNLAYIAHINQDYKSSIKFCDVAINIKPYCSEAYYNRCLSLLKLGSSYYVDASQQINSALSCIYLQKFKLSGVIKYLENAVSYCQNNLQALRLLMLCGDKLIKSQYDKILNKYQDKYTINGPYSQIKLYASAEQGLYRLRSTTFQFKLAQIYKKINLYLTLLSLQNQQNASDNRIQNIKQFQINQTFSITIQPSVKRNSQITYQQIEMKQLKRQSANLAPLRQILNVNLTVPDFSSRFSMKDSIKSFKNNSICDSITSSSRGCHGGCIKCKKQNEQMLAIPFDGVKMYIKTVQIFRNQNIYQPKPYLIVYDGLNEYVTDVDYTGGYFPKWNKVFHLNINNENPYRIELWNKGNKQKQDTLIGTATFQNKKGRFKCYFIKHYGGFKRTGYAFLQLDK